MSLLFFHMTFKCDLDRGAMNVGVALCIPLHEQIVASNCS